MSVLVKDQKKTYKAEWTDEDGDHVLVATVRYDDQCGNGHNSFSITGTLYGSDRIPHESTIKNSKGKTLWCYGGGCVHEEIARHIPELAPYIKWHLVSSDEPMHYVANTMWHAGDRDCWGLRKGESRQLRHGGNGPLCWVLEADAELPKYVDSETQPDGTATLRYIPWCRDGEGKERDLDAARSCAIWPEATDEELMQEPDKLKAALLARLPKLMQEFKDAVESLGFVY